MDKQQQILKRNQYIRNLQQFLSVSSESVNKILHNLNWSKEHTVVKDSEASLTTCPLDSSHRVSSKNLDVHKKKCLWHRQGYRDDSVPYPRSSSRTNASIVIDKKLQAEVILQAASKDPSLKIGENVRDREVAQTTDRYITDFTTDERRILYDYAVQQTKWAVPELKEFSLPSQLEGKTEPMSKEQLLALERDAKRRRVRYRSAKVHTKSKNYSEVMREVISNQMQAYEDWLREQHGVSATFSVETSELQEPAGVEDKTTSSDKEIVCLHWDNRSNPHIRWRQILEREKQFAARRALDRNYDDKHQSRKRGGEESDSERSHHSDRSLKGSRRRDSSHENTRKRDHSHDSKSRRDSSHEDHRRQDYSYKDRRRDSYSEKSYETDKSFEDRRKRKRSSDYDYYTNDRDHQSYHKRNDKWSYERSHHKRNDTYRESEKNHSEDVDDDNRRKKKHKSQDKADCKSTTDHGRSQHYSRNMKGFLRYDDNYTYTDDLNKIKEDSSNSGDEIETTYQRESRKETEEFYEHFKCKQEKSDQSSDENSDLLTNYSHSKKSSKKHKHKRKKKKREKKYESSTCSEDFSDS